MPGESALADADMDARQCLARLCALACFDLQEDARLCSLLPMFTAKLVRSYCAVAAFLVVVACSREPAQVERTPEQQEQHELAALADELREVIDAHPAKCKEMGAALASWYDAKGARFAELRKKHPKLPGDEWARWNRMLQATNRAQVCIGNPALGMDDPSVKRVLKSLE